MLSLHLRHSFGAFRLEADIEAPVGVTALFGRSGSGKTTIVNAVAGLLPVQEGRIELDGRVLLDTARGISLPPSRRRIGYVFQDARLFPHLTVAQNLAYGRFFAPRGASGPEAGRIITLLGLEHLLRRRPAMLSGGEKQRVALGRAILSRPQMLLLDEPLAALDAARKAEILPYFERLRDELALPMLFVSHAADEVARLATTLVLVEAGRTLRSGPLADMLGDPDLATSFGLGEAGAVLMATIAAQEGDGLTRLDTAAGALWLPRIDGAEGMRLRLHVPANAITLALRRPEAVSALNILPVTLRRISPDKTNDYGLTVQLDCAGEPLLARITRRSAALLDLQEGQHLFAMIKALSAERG